MSLAALVAIICQGSTMLQRYVLEMYDVCFCSYMMYFALQMSNVDAAEVQYNDSLHDCVCGGARIAWVYLVLSRGSPDEAEGWWCCSGGAGLRHAGLPDPHRLGPVGGAVLCAGMWTVGW